MKPVAGGLHSNVRAVLVDYKGIPLRSPNRWAGDLELGYAELASIWNSTGATETDIVTLSNIWFDGRTYVQVEAHTSNFSQDNDIRLQIRMDGTGLGSFGWSAFPTWSKPIYQRTPGFNLPSKGYHSFALRGQSLGGSASIAVSTKAPTFLRVSAIGRN